ncbi:cysteine proteinase [Bimuria novae-zelandiae CBS 107.79]|uniref:Cysteine proteinase n=1 Tax=Bimuria novae-zelandiae CBS 107.79 TaxID=1447943 RepID=A0A6A5UNJ4_9PLEO|nr:cysteine proteinase [Bimuria novae-zelandiae CBS 107.79]
MADRLAQLEALKAAASSHEASLQTATTKDETLKQALAAAEKLMGAVKLTVDAHEKKRLTQRFNAVADVARNVKSNTWMPPKSVAPTASSVSPQDSQYSAQTAGSYVLAPESHLSANLQLQSRPKSKADGIGEWAADVAQTVHRIPSGSYPQSTSSIQNTSSATQVATIAAVGNSLTSSPSHLPTALLFYRNTNDENAWPDLSRGTSQSQLDPTVRDDLKARLQEVIQKELPTVKPNTSAAHVRRLREPISSRKRTTKEEIILLKASLVNGVKCPPWDKIPPAEEFALSGSEVYTQPRELSLSPQQQQYFKAWVRAQDAIPRQPSGTDDKPVMSSPRPIDLVQDAATDCSVVASLCAGIARTERGYDKILSTKLYPFDRNLGKPVLSSNGKYIIRLNFNGCWRRVTIDDRLPFSDTRALHVVDKRHPALLWPALLEKAYLTVRGGYDFPGSNSCSDLWAFAGWIPEQIHLQETDIVPDQLWRRLHKAFAFGDVLATLGTGQMSTRQERELGLEGQHSYVILDLKETGHDRLLLVKNPWVEGRGWLGPRPSPEQLYASSAVSDSSKDGLATYHRDTIPTKERPNPPTFWIGLEQVIRHFESLYLNWNPGLFRYRQDIHFEWTVDGSSEEENRCIVTHPQFLFHSEDASPVWFLLSRHFRATAGDGKEGSDAFNDGSIRPHTLGDTSDDIPKGYMSIFVCPGKGNRLYMKDTCLERSDYVTTPQCLLRWDTEANSTYTVVIDQDELPASAYTFSLSAFSNSKIELEPAIPRYPLQKTVTGEWTKQTAGGNTGSSQYFQNPQYALEVKERGRLAILLTSTNRKNALHVKLTLGHGKRIYRLNSRDILADSGDHRARCVFAETKDLEPGVYTIVCSLFEAGQTGDYTLRVDSTNEITLKPIPRDGAGLILNRLAPVCFRPEVNEMVAPMVVQRLASYTIVVRFLKATTSRSTGALPTTRSPLRFSVEFGRGPERQFIITSERGEYSDAAILRTEAVNIDPELYPGGNLSLVMDRLSGPGGPVEEWYEVEVYTDVPKACDIGVWRDRK